MKCFNHPQTDAVGSCKYCCRGVCAECAKNSGVGLVCSDACASEVKALHALVERNKKVYAFAPKTHSRQAIFLALMAVVFIGFGLYSELRFMSAYLIAFGIVMLCGAAFSVFNSRRIARLGSSDQS
jgi:hypothetical protein